MNEHQACRKYGSKVAVAVALLASVSAAIPATPSGVRAGEPRSNSAVSHDGRLEQDAPLMSVARWPMSYYRGSYEPVVEQLPLRSPDATADLVVLISVDGLRPDAITRRTRTLWDLLVQGVAPHRARTIDKSSTLPSHGSMVSGVEPSEHGLRFNAFRPERGGIHVPTVFSLAREAQLPTSMFVGKRKLKHLLAEDSESEFEVPGIFCQRVVREVLPTLRSATEGLIFVHFADPDSAGHRHGWMTEPYHASVRRIDRCLDKLVDTLEEAGRMDRTLVLITADHGGHNRSHGTRLKADQRIPWIAWGAGANARRRVRRTVHTMDTAATALAALGITPPQGIQGKPVVEALGAIQGPDGMPLVGVPLE